MERAENLFVRRVLVAPFEVVADAAAKENRPLRHDADPLYQFLVGEGLYVPTVHGDSARRRVVKVGDEVDERALSAARAADDADDLPLSCRKVYILQRVRARTLVAEAYVFKRDGVRIVHGVVLDTGEGILHVQHGVQAVAARDGLGDGDDEVGELDELHQNLRHIVIQRDDVALREGAGLHLHAARIQEGDDGEVDDDVGRGVHDRGEVAHEGLIFRVRAIAAQEEFFLVRLFVEGAQYPRARKVFLDGEGDLVQLILRFFVKRYGEPRDAEHDEGEQGNGDRKEDPALHVHNKRHDQRAEHDDGGTQKQAEHHVDAVLHLIAVARHSRDHGGGTDLVDLPIAERLQAGKEGAFQLRGKARRRLRREILRRDRRKQSHRGEKDENAAIRRDADLIRIRHADVHDVLDDEGDDKLKHRFQKLEKRRQDTFFFIIFQKSK